MTHSGTQNVLFEEKLKVGFSLYKGKVANSQKLISISSHLHKNERSYCLATCLCKQKCLGTKILCVFLQIGRKWQYLLKLSHLYETNFGSCWEFIIFLFKRMQKCYPETTGWVKRILVGNCNVTIFAPVKLAEIVRITLICLGICELGTSHQSAFFQNISA